MVFGDVLGELLYDNLFSQQSLLGVEDTVYLTLQLLGAGLSGDGLRA